MALYKPQCRAILQVIFDGYADSVRDSDPLIIPVLPKSATINRNSYNQADSWELVFDAGDLPIDPQLVRAGAVEIYIFDANNPNSVERSLLSRRDPLASIDASQNPRSAVDTVSIDRGVALKGAFTYQTKPLIAGGFDQDDLECSESGKWVTISGQDYTALLMGMQWPPLPGGRARRVPVGQRIDDLLRDILAEADPGGKLSLDVRGIDLIDLPIVGKNEVSGSKRGIAIEQQTSYWDVIYKMAVRHGLIAYVDGLDVVLSRSKTITDRDQSAIRRFAWGRNLSNLRLTRKLGTEQSPTIVMRSYDPETRKTLSAEFPPNTISKATVAVTGKAGKTKFKSNVKSSTHTSKKGKVTTTVRERDEYQIHTLYGVTDPKVLARAAENLFNTLGRSEREVTCSTMEMVDLGDGARPPASLVELTAGDAFTVDWDEFNREFLADPKIETATKVDYLISRGFNRAVAQEVAVRYKILDGLSRPLRLKEATIEFDVESGFSLEIVARDFIILDGVRPDVELGSTRTPRVDRNRENLATAAGRPVGWSKDAQTANQRRTDKR